MPPIEVILDEFKDVFDDTSITPMKGDPMFIHVNKNSETYKPMRTLTARPVPVHFQSEAKKATKILVDSGIIKKMSEPTDWISPAFFVPKPDGRVRLVCDFTGLNKFVSRPVHPFPCPHDIIRGLKSTSKFFIKLDAVQGYHQIPLCEESQKLTTFLLPEGRFCYLRAPMGLNASSDAWCSRSDEAFLNLDILKIVDDVLIQAPNKEEAFIILEDVLLRCREFGITLSKKKMKMGTSVHFAGYIISDKGVMPDPARTAALSEFPVPTDISTVRGFLGLANQLGLFVPDLTHMTDPLRLLLKKDVVFEWRPEHQVAFDKVKKALTSDLVVGVYDPSKDTELLTDASKLYGLGYALIQYDNKRPRLIQCGSRSLLPAESRYATIELECLAVQWATQSCKHYTLGKAFKIVTDHKPLLGIFAKPLSEVLNNRLLRFREKMVDYRFSIAWVPGKTHIIADTLSRSPAFQPAETDVVVNSLNIRPRSAVSIDPALNLMVKMASEDPVYQELLSALVNNVSVHKLPRKHPAWTYKPHWENISVYKDSLLILDGTRIIVPFKLRSAVLSSLHESHAGFTKTHKLAKQIYFWPGLSVELKNLIDCCEPCQRLRPSQGAEPLQLYPPAAAPMTDVSIDLFEAKSGHYLVMVDRFSGFPFVVKLKALHTAAITNHLMNWFVDFGFPRYLTSDGGPQMRSEFVQWCHKHFITHTLSSAYHPQSNGLAESGVKSLKYLLLKLNSSSELPLKLLHWRNMPRVDSVYSPAELFFGRQQRRLLPVLPEISEKSLFPQQPTVQTSLPIQQRELAMLKVGQKVRVQHPKSKRWENIALIHEIRHSGRSYIVKYENGRFSPRNRIHLKPFIEKTGRLNCDLSVQQNRSTQYIDNSTDSSSPCLDTATAPERRRSARIKNNAEKARARPRI